MQDKVKTDSLGLLYENLANVDNLADYWATQSKCSPQYHKRSALYIGPQIPRTSRLLEATRVITHRLRLYGGLHMYYMPYLNEPDTIMRQQEQYRPPKDMPLMLDYFKGCFM